MITFSGTFTTGITLSSAAIQNPATLAAGGYVTNSTASYGGDAIYGTTAAAWTVANYGTIKGTLSSSNGIALKAGGDITNAASTATITGYLNGVYITGSAGTVVNSGTIKETKTGTFDEGVNLAAGGTVTNMSSGLIQSSGGFAVGANAGGTGVARVINYGTISGGDGIQLASSGAITNAASGLITAGNAGIIAYGANSIANSGTISAGGDFGIDLVAGGTVINSGLIASAAPSPANPLYAKTYGVGVFRAGGTVINYGRIQGNGVGIGFGYPGATLTAVGSVVNFGTISGTAASGIGVQFRFSNSTLTNAGTIVGSSGTAVAFSGTANRLIVDPGAVFSGIVTGGTANALELASTASTGTLSGLGTSFTNVGSVSVDSGAVWQLSGSNSLGAAVTLSNAGTLTIAATTTLAGSVTNSGTVAIGGGALFAIVSTAGGGGRIAFSGAAGTLEVTGTVSPGGTILPSDTIGNFVGGEVIDLRGIPLNASHGSAFGGNNKLVILEGTNTYTLQLDPAQNFSGDTFNLGTDGGGGTLLTVSQSGTTSVGTYTTGIVLSNPTTQNPSTVAATGYVTNTTTSHNGDAVYGTSAAAWTFSNYGAIKAASGNASGVDLIAGGTVSNFGTIAATAANSSGVRLASGGNVKNAGLISAYRGIYIGVFYNGGGLGSVVNSGTIEATGTVLGLGDSAIHLGAGGSVTNASSGLVQSDGASYTVRIDNNGAAAGTLVNLGTIGTPSVPAC